MQRDANDNKAADAFVERCLASHVAANAVMVLRHHLRIQLKEIERDPVPVNDPNIDDGPAVMDFTFSRYDPEECKSYTKERCGDIASLGAESVNNFDAHQFIDSLSFRPAKTDHFDMALLNDATYVDINATGCDRKLPCVTVLRDVAVEHWMNTASLVQSLASDPNCVDKKAAQEVAQFFNDAVNGKAHLWTPSMSATLSLLDMSTDPKSNSNPLLSVLAATATNFCANPKMAWQLGVRFDAEDIVTIRE
jgi:hypothetical protein